MRRWKKQKIKVLISKMQIINKSKILNLIVKNHKIQVRFQFKICLNQQKISFIGCIDKESYYDQN